MVIAGAAAFGTVHVLAKTPPGQYPSIVQALASKFGLNPSDVQAVFTQNRQNHMSQMETRYEQMLTQAVTDGKITSAQQQLILAKHKELQSARQTTMQQWKTMTPDQRKAAMQTQKQAIADWAKQNGIDPKYLSGGFGGFGMRAHWQAK